MSNNDNKTIQITLKNYKQYLDVLNGLFNLTDKEKAVFIAFLRKKEEIDNSDIEISAFSVDVKKQVAEQLGMDDFNSLNVYIKRLKDKNALIYKNQKYYFNPILVKKKNEKKVTFLWQEKKKL